MKDITDYTLAQIQDELIKMLTKLDIAGSTADYDLYRAITVEYEKAVKADKKYANYE